jgi:hypothetical protein
MSKNEQLAIGIGIVGVALAYYWQQRNTAILNRISSAIAPTAFQPLPGAIQHLPSLSPSTGGPVAGGPIGPGSIPALPGAVDNLPPLVLNPVTQPDVVTDPITGDPWWTGDTSNGIPVADTLGDYWAGAQ